MMPSRKISTQGWILFITFIVIVLLFLFPFYRKWWNIQVAETDSRIRLLELQTTSKVIEDTSRRIRENPEYLKVLWIQSLSNSKQIIYIPTGINGQIVLNKD